MPYGFNGTVPKVYGTPTTGINGLAEPSPFVGAAAAEKGHGIVMAVFIAVAGVMVHTIG